MAHLDIIQSTKIKKSKRFTVPKLKKALSLDTIRQWAHETASLVLDIDAKFQKKRKKRKRFFLASMINQKETK